MKKILYFAYGSNCNIEQMARRCPKAEPVGVATLFDYCLMMRGVADIAPAKSAKVEGVLWELTAECVKALDGYEGYPYLYGKKQLKIRHGKKWVKALIYDMQFKTKEYRPCKDYYDIILNAYRWWGIADHQLNDACDFGKGEYWSDRTARRVVSLHKTLPMPDDLVPSPVKYGKRTQDYYRRYPVTYGNRQAIKYDWDAYDWRKN